MRTTVRLDDGLLHDVREYAARQGRTLTSVLEESLRRLLAEAASRPEAEPVTLPVSTAGGGVLPGVDLDDSAGLADLMDAAFGR